MTFVQYGGIQRYGQLLHGWMKYGVLGSETEIGGDRQYMRLNRDERDLMDILMIIAGSGVLN